MMCMDEEKDNAKTAEEKESEEREEQPEEGEPHNVQEGAQVPMTFEEMLSRCEEQIQSAHDSTKIKFETWDVTMRCAAEHMEPNMVTLGPQDDSEEPSIHPAVVHMDAVRIIETIDVLQATLHHQQQLLNLYHAKAQQDERYTPISEQ